MLAGFGSARSARAADGLVATEPVSGSASGVESFASDHRHYLGSESAII